MISGEIEVNLFAWIHLILEEKFEGDPLSMPQKMLWTVNSY